LVRQRTTSTETFSRLASTSTTGTSTLTSSTSTILGKPTTVAVTALVDDIAVARDAVLAQLRTTMHRLTAARRRVEIANTRARANA
jgi:hypothetical protein